MNATEQIEAQVINVYRDRINGLQRRIELSQEREKEIERQLEAQRRETENLKQHEQAQLTLRSASITVLKEAINAFRLADGIDPTGESANELLDTIGSLREAIWNKEDLPELPSDEEFEKEQEDDGAPNDGDGDGDGTITVESQAVDESGNGNGNGNSPGAIVKILSLNELMELNYKTIRKLAVSKNKLAKGSRQDIAERLVGIVTQGEVDRVKLLM